LPNKLRISQIGSFGGKRKITHLLGIGDDRVELNIQFELLRNRYDSPRNSSGKRLTFIKTIWEKVFTSKIGTFWENWLYN
jgi:hypothetical protein